MYCLLDVCLVRAACTAVEWFPIVMFCFQTGVCGDNFHLLMCPVGVSFYVESNLVDVHSFVAWYPTNIIKVLCGISGCCFNGTDLVFMDSILISKCLE